MSRHHAPLRELPTENYIQLSTTINYSRLCKKLQQLELFIFKKSSENKWEHGFPAFGIIAPKVLSVRLVLLHSPLSHLGSASEEE